MRPRVAAEEGVDALPQFAVGRGRAVDELQHIAAVIERWLRMQSVGIPEEPAQGRLL